MRTPGVLLLWLGWVALIYHVALNGSYAALLYASVLGLNRQQRRERYVDYQSVGRSPFTPPVSVILPAFNEELTVSDSVEALRKLDYPEAEIIVVNDGSTDGTLGRLIRVFKLRPVDRIVRTKEPGGSIELAGRIRGFYASPPGEGVRDVVAIDKENGGKADALNAGILASRFSLCTTVDADSILEVDALLRAVRPFLDEPQRTIAVGGLVRVANGSKIDKGRVVELVVPRRVLPLAQVVEYFRSFLGARFGLASLRSLLILSGAFAVFRRSALFEIGGFRRETITEDMEIVCALHRHMKEVGRPYDIAYIPDPIAWTEAPEKLTHLRRQRMRWQRGLLQVLSLHRRVMFRPRYGVVGWFAFPYHLVFEGLGPVLELAGFVLVPIGWALGIVDGVVFLLFLSASILYGLALSAFALFLHTRSRMYYAEGMLRLAAGAVIEAFALRPMLAFFRAVAVIQHVLGRKPEWGAKERTGFSSTGA